MNTKTTCPYTRRPDEQSEVHMGKDTKGGEISETERKNSFQKNTQSQKQVSKEMFFKLKNRARKRGDKGVRSEPSKNAGIQENTDMQMEGATRECRYADGGATCARPNAGAEGGFCEISRCASSNPTDTP